MSFKEPDIEIIRYYRGRLKVKRLSKKPFKNLAVFEALEDGFIGEGKNKQLIKKGKTFITDIRNCYKNIGYFKIN